MGEVLLHPAGGEETKSMAGNKGEQGHDSGRWYLDWDCKGRSNLPCRQGTEER